MDWVDCRLALAPISIAFEAYKKRHLLVVWKHLYFVVVSILSSLRMKEIKLITKCQCSYKISLKLAVWNNIELKTKFLYLDISNTYEVLEKTINVIYVYYIELISIWYRTVSTIYPILISNFICKNTSKFSYKTFSSKGIHSKVTFTHLSVNFSSNLLKIASS